MIAAVAAVVAAMVTMAMLLRMVLVVVGAAADTAAGDTAAVVHTEFDLVVDRTEPDARIVHIASAAAAVEAAVPAAASPVDTLDSPAAQSPPP